MSFYTIAPPVYGGTVVFMLGYEERVDNPAKKGRENEFITFFAAD